MSKTKKVLKNAYMRLSESLDRLVRSTLNILTSIFRQKELDLFYLKFKAELNEFLLDF